MKITICTTPIGPESNDFPPFGSLAVIQALRKVGYDPRFLDIDGLRPSFSEVIEKVKQESPDILGISAVVSTAYGYVKELCQTVRKILPGVKIVLGGNLAASAELLHRVCQVDVCAIGEGEKIVVNLANYYSKHRQSDDLAELEKIKGLTFLNQAGDFVFTGYETAIPAPELLDPDYSILEQYSNIKNYVNDPFTRPDFSSDPRSYEPHRRDKKMGTVIFTKGCVARCTFCHRWDKGFRQLPPEKIIAQIKHLMDRYNVGFIQFGDENFGSDRKATDELIRLITPLDVLWKVSGVRAGTIDFDRLRRMREAGCVALYYGFETGSPEILQVMEKKLDVTDNYATARATFDAGLFTVYQLVLGMPGETHKTISDTIEMVKQVTEFLPDPPHKLLSVNYIQALPGTPVYEFARARGLIGPTLADEEAYLLTVSDTAAGDDTKFLNFTHYPYMTVQSWRPRLLYEATVHWHRHRRLRGESSGKKFTGEKKTDEWGEYFNLHEVRNNPVVLEAFYPFRSIIIWGWTILSVYRRSEMKVFLKRLWELMLWPFRKSDRFNDYRSLRHAMRDIASPPETINEQSMMPLRLGR
jgi:radical SAM superfamily enzyme YgiQ (UPF0313 family)